MGAGLYRTWVPTIEGGSENTGNNEAYYLDETNEVFAEPQEPAKVSHDKYRNDPQTPCHIMADVAQNEANDALMQNRGNDQAALDQFDKTFSTLYVGGPLTDSFEAFRWRGGTGRTINSNFPFTGGDGFSEKYKDSGKNADPLIAGPKADQTHHYAAHQSLGINMLVLPQVVGLVREDNQGDINLSKAAYEIGFQLRRKPFNLRNIGAIIRRDICSGPGHGLYK